MTFYFRLQYHRICRWFLDHKIHPLWGAIALLAIFIVGSNLLFVKTQYALWIYGTIFLSLLIRLGEKKRISIIRSIYTRPQARRIRILENVLVLIPFVCYLIYERQFHALPYFFGLSLLLALTTMSITSNRVIPTPFAKRPFEYIVGFRKAIIFTVLIYFALIKGIQFNNFNLSAFCLGALFLLGMTFYQKPEHKFFVWIFAYDPTQFLKQKVKAALTNQSILTLPALVLNLIVFPEYWHITSVIFVLGVIFVSSMVIVKYSSFPYEIGLPQAILYGFSLAFPLLLIYTTWFFLKKARVNLKPVLEC